MSESPQDSLETLDPSRPGTFADGSWREHFARLRAEDPVHYCADSPNGPYWSITRHGDIKAVDMNHTLFSSEVGGITIAEPELDEAIRLDNFISMDEPKHAAQRKTVAPSVAPTNLARLEPLIRERVVDILEHLPVGTPFNWVPAVSVELTARMLATLFEFPYEDRHKLIHWSDITTASPELMGEAGVTREVRAAAPQSSWEKRGSPGKCALPHSRTAPKPSWASGTTGLRSRPRPISSPCSYTGSPPGTCTPAPRSSSATSCC